MQDMSSDISTLVNNAWKNGELTQLNNQYQKALTNWFVNKFKENRILTNEFPMGPKWHKKHGRV